MEKRILVVDDDKSMVKMIKDVLEMEGYRVFCAFDGQQALIKAQQQPDLILLDINLPEMDGIEVCEKISHSPDRRAGPYHRLEGWRR